MCWSGLLDDFRTFLSDSESIRVLQLLACFSTARVNQETSNATIWVGCPSIVPPYPSLLIRPIIYATFLRRFRLLIRPKRNRTWVPHPNRVLCGYALWTRQAVSELIEGVYGVRLTVRNMGKYLKR